MDFSDLSYEKKRKIYEMAALVLEENGYSQILYDAKYFRKEFMFEEKNVKISVSLLLFIDKITFHIYANDIYATSATYEKEIIKDIALDIESNMIYFWFFSMREIFDRRFAYCKEENKSRICIREIHFHENNIKKISNIDKNINEMNPKEAFDYMLGLINLKSQ